MEKSAALRGARPAFCSFLDAHLKKLNLPSIPHKINTLKNRCFDLFIYFCICNSQKK
jgi:hypothetical protein